MSISKIRFEPGKSKSYNPNKWKMGNEYFIIYHIKGNTEQEGVKCQWSPHQWRGDHLRHEDKSQNLDWKG